MNYFVVYFGEDGMTITQMSKEKVEKMINDLVEEQTEPPKFVERYPTNGNRWDMDGEYPEGKYLIIKGELVIPQPVQTVTKFEI